MLKPGGVFLCKLWDGYGTKGSKLIFHVTAVGRNRDIIM